MARTRSWPGVLLAALGGCSSAGLPEGSGRGLVSWDRTAPEGLESFDRPQLAVGDRFVFRRGGISRLSLTVTAADEDGYVLTDDASRALTRYTLDLGEIGEEFPGDPQNIRRQEPADALCHWPLWVGKRWSCHFLRKAPGAEPLPLLATYACEAEEDIEVPGGTFRCLRIWRHVRVAATGRFLERASVMWYAPEVGFFVRRLENGTLLELEEVHRQRR
ncbi:MAG: hypothetical protein AAF628_21340 [Planctomycetota bacterium]